MTQNPNRLLTREKILDAVTGPGSDKNDRNIDFLINRLRRKLSDDTRNPRYIATRYGEGYVWIGSGATIDTHHADAYMIVGPLRGLDNLAGGNDQATRFAADLRGSLQSELKSGQRVVLAPDCPPPTAFGEQMPTLSVELSFFEEGHAVHCVASAREFRSSRILAIRRVALPMGDRAAAMQSAAEIARLLLAEIWRTLAAQTDIGLPLPVSMYMASTQPDHARGSLDDSDSDLRKIRDFHENRAMAAWEENNARLQRLRQADPGDAALKVMHATHIHSKYVLFGYALFQKGIDDRIRDEDDIEALVLSALPLVQSQPEYAIMAAKLLHFVDRGYGELALALAEDAYGASVSAAGSLSIIGQLRAFSGETEAALRCVDQAINLVARGSRAHLYALTIKMQTLRAVADFDRLRATKRELYSLAAAAMFVYEPMFADPDRLSVRARAIMSMLSRERASAMLKMNNYVAARLFRVPEHGANNILTPLTLIVRRFGTAAVPDEVIAAHPGLLDRLA